MASHVVLAAIAEELTRRIATCAVVVISAVLDDPDAAARLTAELPTDPSWWVG